MYYNGKSQTLEGVPSEADMDQYYLTVTAYGHETNGSISRASDVFLVSVVPDTTSQSATTATPLHKAPSRGVKCINEEPAVTATIVLDANWGKLEANHRMESISKMSQYSRLGVEKFRLLPASSKSLLDMSVLVAGPGNVRRAENPGISLSWQIGCGTNADKFPVVTILESAAKDGTMATKLGHNIIGWHVTHDKPKVNRVRRQAHLMGTPLPTPTPSDMPPKPTAVMGTSQIPATRVIPIDASPSIMPSAYNPSMIATIMPTRVVPPIEETTMVVPTTMEIKPTPMPPKNTPPKIDVPITRIDAVEWQVFSYRIPANAFIDAEEGNTRALKLALLDMDSGKELSKKSWLQFNKVTQTMQGLPLTDDVRYTDLMIVAQDSQGLYARMPFQLRVKAAPPAAADPPSVTMGMSLDLDFDEFMDNPALQLEILNKIASVFGDEDPSAITFTNIQRGSVILSWTNNTLPTDECSIELIKEIIDKLVGPDGKPTQDLIDAFDPLEITGVQASATGACSNASYDNPMTTVAPPGTGGASSGGNLTRIIIIVVVIATLFILLIIGIILCLHCRRNCKSSKLAHEDQKTFSNSKGIPIIFSDEMEDPEKPQSSSTPLIMREEKPPLPPPQYSEDGRQQPRGVKDRNRANVGNHRNNVKQNVPMIELSGSPPYKPPPAPLASNYKPPPAPDSHAPSTRSKPKYRAPPAYVPP